MGGSRHSRREGVWGVFPSGAEMPTKLSARPSHPSFADKGSQSAQPMCRDAHQELSPFELSK